MSFKASVQLSFSAAHQLKGYKGRCENMHGHNWRVQVCCKAENLDKQGMVVDFAVLKMALNKVLMRLDHKVLNDLPYFKKVNPTSENIAKYIYNKIKSEIRNPKSEITKVTVWETDNCCATYYASSSSLRGAKRERSAAKPPRRGRSNLPGPEIAAPLPFSLKLRGTGWGSQ